MPTATRASTHVDGSTEATQTTPEPSSPKASSESSSENSPGTTASGEGPVRHKLKKTSINPGAETSAKEDIDEANERVATPETTADVRAIEAEKDTPLRRVKNKRSYDEIEPDTPGGPEDVVASKQLRKRSRSDDGKSSSGEDDTGATDPFKAVDGQESVPEPVKAVVTADEPIPAVPLVATDIPENSEAPQKAAVKATTPPPAVLKSSEASLANPRSPLNKRSRDQFARDDKDEKASDPVHERQTEVKDDTAKPLSANVQSSDPEPEKKRSRDGAAASERVTSPKIPPTSGFANTSAQSPFSSLASPKSTSAAIQQTSTKAFASSGFASFASASSSPFGAFGSSKPAPPSKDSAEIEKPAVASSGFASLGASKSSFASTAPSTFGSANGFGKTSGFGSGSGFGSLSNGFGGTGPKLGAAAPLTSFASSGGTGIIGGSSKPVKAFGASADDDEQEEGETSELEDNAIKANDDGPKDPRFFEQDVETGEEGEETVYSQRAKLYVNTDKQWKERGVGVFKVNVAYSFNEGGSDASDEDPEKAAETRKTARLIMRADGSHRIVLNSPLTKDITVKDPAGGPPKGRNVIFLGFIDGSPKLMQLKMKSNVQTEELYETVTHLQRDL